jgi:Ca-activated chloride channel family protein
MLDWVWPWAFTLLPLPLLARYLMRPATDNTLSLRVPFYDSLNTGQIARPRRDWQSPLLASIVWLGLVAACARPVWYGAVREMPTGGRDLLLAIDLSDSMRIQDMRDATRLVTRMEAIKRVAAEFIERRRGDRLGLILFGQRSYLQTPLTFDRRSVALQLSETLPGFAGSSTAIGDAIGQAIVQLRDRPAESRVLVLMTDGSNTFGSEPLAAGAIAKEAGIRIHTIGVGAQTLRVVDVEGREQEIDPSRDLDENTLQQIAEMTGGQYFRARDPAEMASIYAAVDELEPTPEPRLIRPQMSLFHWPLGVALLALAVVLVRARYR